MTEIVEFREAKLTLGNDDIPFVVEASIEESWDTLSFPIYRDKMEVRTVPTVKVITVRVRRKYEESSPMHTALDGNPLTLVFDTGGETIGFSQARVVEWKVSGQIGGEMIENVVLRCEGEV